MGPAGKTAVMGIVELALNSSTVRFSAEGGSGDKGTRNPHMWEGEG